MHILLKKILIIILLLFPEFIFSKQPVVFVLPAGEEGLERFKQWSLLIEYLNTKSELSIDFEIVEDHLAIQYGIDINIYDIAFVDPLWSLVLSQRNLCEPLVRAVIKNNSESNSILIVHKDSIIHSILDLTDKKIGLLMPYESATGFYIPLAILKMNNMPILDNKYFVFSDTFISILKGVAYDRLDAGFIDANIYLNPENALQLNEIRVISKSISVPQWTIVMRKGLQESTIKIIKNLLLDAHNSQAGKKALSQANIDKFILAEDKDYKGLKDYLEKLGENFAPAK